MQHTARVLDKRHVAAFARRIHSPPSASRFVSFPSRAPNFARLLRPGHRPQPTSLSPPRVFHRNASWASKLSWRAPEDPSASDCHEDPLKAAILDKVMQGRQPADLLLRCTIIDAEGNVKTISGQFKKSNLCSEHRLNPRDLRKIDSRIPNLVPTILVRKEAVLVNILHLRALVKADTVILFDTFGSTDSRLHSTFLYHLQHNLKSATVALPYEFRALESILLSVLSALEAELVFLRALVGGLLAELEDDIDRDRFKRLLHAARRLAGFQNRARLVQAALEEVLEQDEDLEAMHLTERRRGVQSANHEELEVLLESFEKQVEEITNEAETIQSNVQSTQEIVELILDSNRNALLALDLKVSIGTMGIGVGALVAGLFGMNLTSHLEDTSAAFAAVSALAVVVSAGVAWGGLRRLAKIRKVGLGGHAHARGVRTRGPGGLPGPLRERRDWMHWSER